MFPADSMTVNTSNTNAATQTNKTANKSNTLNHPNYNYVSDSDSLGDITHPHYFYYDNEES